MAQQVQQLKKVLRPVHLWAIAVGLVISGEYFGWNYGWGVASTIGFLIATIIITIMYITFVFSYTELTTSIPHAGGAFAYAYRAMGPIAGLIAGYATLVDFIFVTPAIASGLGSYLHFLYPELSILPSALVFYLIFMAINIAGVKESAMFSLIISILAVAELLLFMGIVTPSFKMENFTNNGMPFGWTGIFAALPFAIWFYLAIEGVAMVAEEVKDPKKDIPKGYISGIATLVLLAFGVMILTGGISDWHKLSNIDYPLPEAIGMVLGKASGLTKLFAGIGLFGLIASFHGTILAYSRQVFAMARSGYLPRFLATVSPRFKTPHWAIMVGTIIGIIALYTCNTAQIIIISALGAIVMYVMSMVSLFVLRVKEPDLERPFSAPFYPVFPAVALLITLVSMVAIIYYNLIMSLVFFAGMLVAITIFTLMGKHKQKIMGEDMLGQTDLIIKIDMAYQHTIRNKVYRFNNLRILLAKASPYRSGDALAGLVADSYEERVAAQITLADVPLKNFLNEAIIPYESDEVTRLIIDSHSHASLAPIDHFTVGELRDWLLAEETDTATLHRLAPGITPEIAAAVSKLMRNQDLIAVAKKCEVVTRFRNTIGLHGHFSTRLQPNHPTDDIKGVAASMIDGLLYGSGDAVIGINPATDSPAAVVKLLNLIDTLREQFDIPTQSCVLCHLTTTLQIINQNAPVDLTFQSIGGTEQTNTSFGVSLALIEEAYQATLSLNRGTLGQNVMYFETGQGSSLSANANHGVDQQTCETRAYAVARKFNPLLVNTVVGFIGPEYLYDGKQIIRAALEDHFCGKLMGLPMGVDVCYTNHAEADQDDMDNLLTLLGVAGCNFVMGIPGSDDIMLNYQSTSFHDALYLRKVLGLKPAPEFEQWLIKQGIFDQGGLLHQNHSSGSLLQNSSSWIR